MSSVKILVCGDIEGNFDFIFSKVKAINQSHGPFRALFCVGNFFSKKTDDFSGAVDATSEQWITGKKRVPVPTYFIDGSSGTDIPQNIQRHGGELCPGIIFLGRYGVREIDNVKVAFLNGVYDPFCYKAASSQSITSYTENEITSFTRTLETKYKNQIDILLTSEWPKGIFNNISRSSVPSSLRKHPGNIGANAVQHVVKHATPRYHFCGLEGVFFERAPYSNPSSKNVTRFISLGKIPPPIDPHDINNNNNQQQKQQQQQNERFLYAAGVNPIAVTEGIPKPPQNTTPSPFEHVVISSSKSSSSKSLISGEKRREREHDNNIDNNNNDNNNEEEFKRPQKRRKHQHHQQYKQIQKQKQKQSFKPSPCWFCMSSSNFAGHLVVSIGDHCYVTLPKGGVTHDHVLVVPIEHVASSTKLSTAAVKEMEVVKDALRKMFRDKKRKTVLFYERNCWSPKQATQAHLQIQVIPIPLNNDNNDNDNNNNERNRKENEKSSECAEKFESFGKQKGIEFDVISPQISFLDAVKKAGCDQSQYLAIELPDKTKMVHQIDRDKKHPLQFARTVCAEILGMPERADWRQCAMSEDEETKITQEFRQDLKPYDVLL